MFTFLRGVLIIAVIFYFSPARNTADMDASRDAPGATPARSASSASRAGEESNLLDSLWNKIVGGLAEEAARTAVEDKAHQLGLRLGEAGPSSAPGAARQWAEADSSRAVAAQLRGSPGPSIRCVYRCDGAE